MVSVEMFITLITSPFLTLLKKAKHFIRIVILTLEFFSQ